MDEIAALIEPHIPALRRYAWSLLRDRDGADDLVQDTLERAVGRWQLRRRDGNVRAWLFAILHNHFVSQTRSERRRGARVDYDDDLAAPAQPPDERLTLRDVLAGLDSLPGDQRAVLLLVGVEEFDYSEAARILGVPVGTVMSRLSRGRERLRLFLDAEAPRLRRVK
ncbi:RNA polymerase sigma-70 factor (ECF subfamily) [Ancylobacter sp. 3268]|uniref:RNA polymerase sigma factor n=1 Tax=Ancylobacter sp. 3268 TaxID=2817752 RepID=UPI00285A0F64|nr:sigma-70 family RNA polymerase sigma factor [Ancylobacter sp. 3268]MDR6953209.1 RNA polymerase sigma-70 factor (ECF subfamily) [Ancylobacter sp. 3268]